MATADSSLVNETYWLTTHYSNRSGSITDICIHHMAGNLTLKQCYNTWQSAEASAHYAIDSDGNIGQFVPEAKKAWACGNGNSQTINIELADDTIGKSDGTGWHTSDKCIESCIKLVADIAKRYGWSSVTFDGTNKAKGNHNIVVHKWFMSTVCPCDYVYSKLPYIAEQANKLIKGEVKTVAEEKTVTEIAREWAIEQGLISGYGNGEYGWKDNLTRSQMAIMLYRFYEKFIKNK